MLLSDLGSAEFATIRIHVILQTTAVVLPDVSRDSTIIHVCQQIFNKPITIKPNTLSCPSRKTIRSEKPFDPSDIGHALSCGKTDAHSFNTETDATIVLFRNKLEPIGSVQPV